MEATPPAPPPPKRRWFQLRLSTCVVMMLAAGAIMYVNFVPRSVELYGIAIDQWGNSHRIEDPLTADPGTSYFQSKRYGFPEVYMRTYDEVVFKKGRWVSTRDTNTIGPSSNIEMRLMAFFDLLVGLGVVIIIAVAAEFLARRKHQPPHP